MGAAQQANADGFIRGFPEVLSTSYCIIMLHSFILVSS